MAKTLIIVLLDKSGSMATKKSDVIGGFNTFLNNQQKVVTDAAKMYLLTFNTIVTIVENGVPLESVPELTETNYTPGGGTALYDAIAEGVRVADNDKTDDERVICLIMTDGEENSSRETTKQQVRDIITGHEARGDWSFVYIGEEPDRWTGDMKMTRIDVPISQPTINYLRQDYPKINHCLNLSMCSYSTSNVMQFNAQNYDLNYMTGDMLCSELRSSNSKQLSDLSTVTPNDTKEQ
ncbi:uncharacterized protein LOC128961835 [Oppia nitens]|uniref:uncharacterized protein LOC128961835 n=1 Tax=Oppia nitens TaxID=1686743 RepID=UPI0023DB5A2C|nr:uncharacterized protein LOC128961835 [Oppia nitens]